MIALIAALDRRQAIGRGNALPWHLPEDLKRFKQLTLGHTVLMGSRTARSIGRALPGRRNLVLTRSGQAPFSGQIAVASVDEALTFLPANDSLASNLLFVIGGGEVYGHCLDRADRMYLTWVDTRIDDADTWFPPFDAARWRVLSESAHAADERHRHAFRFVDYGRVSAFR